MFEGPSAETVTAAARALIGAPYRHQGRHVGNGLDCVGLLVLTARACGILLEDYARYPVHGDPPRMFEMLDRELERVTVDIGQSGAGQWWAVRQKRHPRHLLYFTGTSVVQSNMEAGKVCEHSLDADLTVRVEAAWRLRWQP